MPRGQTIVHFPHNWHDFKRSRALSGWALKSSSTASLTLVRTNFGPTYRPKPYPEQVREMAGWVRAHRDLYPHYEVI